MGNVQLVVLNVVEVGDVARLCHSESQTPACVDFDGIKIGLELQSHRMKSRNLPKVLSSTAAESEHGEKLIDLNFPAFHPLKSLQNLTLR